LKRSTPVDNPFVLAHPKQAKKIETNLAHAGLNSTHVPF